MTYCGLSHLAQAYQSNVNGDSLELKVMSQLKNNLVMFDNISKEPIAQVYGTMINSSTKLNSVPSTVMPYSSFKQLYPQGLVFNYHNSNIFDKLVYGMLEKTIYSQGGQYDKSTKELSFPSIKHIDERLHAKEQIYGVEINGESVAYTKEFLIRKGGTITEIVGKKTITVKYFDEFDFVNIYEGNVPEVDEKGFINKIQCKALPHYNRMLWKVWANFFKNTDVRI